MAVSRPPTGVPEISPGDSQRSSLYAPQIRKINLYFTDTKETCVNEVVDTRHSRWESEVRKGHSEN